MQTTLRTSIPLTYKAATRRYTITSFKKLQQRRFRIDSREIDNQATQQLGNKDTTHWTTFQGRWGFLQIGVLTPNLEKTIDKQKEASKSRQAVSDRNKPEEERWRRRSGTPGPPPRLRGKRADHHNGVKGMASAQKAMAWHRLKRPHRFQVLPWPMENPPRPSRKA